MGNEGPKTQRHWIILIDNEPVLLMLTEHFDVSGISWNQNWHK